MNDKNIYDMLNDVDGSVDDFEKIEPTDIEKANFKKAFCNKKKKNRFKKASIVAASLLICVGLFGQTSIGKVAYAKVENTLGGITYSIAKSLYLKKEVAPYVNVVNEVVEDKGIAIKLTDCVIDKDEFILTLLANKDGYDMTYLDIDYSIYINGVRQHTLGSSGSSGVATDGVCFQTMRNDIKGIEKYENLDVKIVVDKITINDKDDYENAQIIKGNWVFEFGASGSELAVNTKIINIDKTFEKDGIKMEIKEISINPVNKKMYVNINENGDRNNDYVFKGKDNLGNDVEFGLSRYDGSTGEAIFIYEQLSSNMSDNAEYVTLTPYFRQMPKKSGRITDDYNQLGDEFKIVLK